jgi:hypothetical protein
MFPEEIGILYPFFAYYTRATCFDNNNRRFIKAAVERGFAQKNLKREVLFSSMLLPAHRSWQA